MEQPSLEICSLSEQYNEEDLKRLNFLQYVFSDLCRSVRALLHFTPKDEQPEGLRGKERKIKEKLFSLKKFFEGERSGLGMTLDSRERNQTKLGKSNTSIKFVFPRGDNRRGTMEVQEAERMKSPEEKRRVKLKPLLNALKYLRNLLQKFQQMVRLKRQYMAIEYKHIRARCLPLQNEIQASNQRTLMMKTGTRLAKIVGRSQPSDAKDYIAACKEMFSAIGKSESEVKAIGQQIQDQIARDKEAPTQGRKRLAELIEQNERKFLWKKRLLQQLMEYFVEKEGQQIVSMDKKYKKLGAYFRTRYQLSSLFLGEDHLLGLGQLHQTQAEQRIVARRNMAEKMVRKEEGSSQANLSENLKNKIQICEILETTHVVLQKHSMELRFLEHSGAKAQQSQEPSTDCQGRVARWQRKLDQLKKCQRRSKKPSMPAQTGANFYQEEKRMLSRQLRARNESKQEVDQVLDSIKNIREEGSRPYSQKEEEKFQQLQKYFVRNYDITRQIPRQKPIAKKQDPCHFELGVKRPRQQSSFQQEDDFKSLFSEPQGPKEKEQTAKPGQRTAKVEEVLERASKFLNRINGRYWYFLDQLPS